MKKTILLGFLMVSVIAGMAQGKQNAAPAKPAAAPSASNAPVAELSYSEVLTAVYTNMNAYFNSNTPNLEPVSRYFSSDFLFVRNSADIGGTVRTVRWTAEDYMRELKGIKDNGLKAERKLERVVFSQEVGNLANVSAIISIRFTQDTATVAMVYAFVSHSLVKENGNWKIKNMTTDRVAESQFYGVCPCRISKVKTEGTDQYTAKVLFPNGSGLEMAEYAISFKGQANLSIVTVGSNYYTWKENIVYTAKVGDNSTPEMLGKANSQIEVITLILAKNMHRDQCTKFEPLK